MNHLLRLTLLVALSSLVFGCGDHQLEVDNDDSDDPPDETQQNDVEPTPQFQQAAYDTLEPRCEKIFDCCDESEMETILGSGNFDDVDDCVDSESGLFGTGSSILESSYISERIDFNEVAVDGCIESIGNLSCDDFHSHANITEELPGCRNMIEPLVDEGEACSRDYECTVGICHIEQNEDEGLCTALPDQEGQDCLDLTCGLGLYCDTFEDTCRPMGNEGDECDDDDQCTTGYCTTTADDNMTCQDRGEAMCTG